MYLQTFGGSALLHLLAAHPRVVALLGIGGTVIALMAPQAPGRVVGTAGTIERIEAGLRQHAAITEPRQDAAERAAVRLLEQGAPGDITVMVRSVLRSCGAGCTDISTDRIMSDRALLVRVLMLYELDEAAKGRRPRDGAIATN